MRIPKQNVQLNSMMNRKCCVKQILVVENFLQGGNLRVESLDGVVRRHMQRPKDLAADARAKTVEVKLEQEI